MVRFMIIKELTKGNDNNMDNQGEVIIYQMEVGLTRIEVKLEGETVWLSQQQMADLYQTSRTNVVEHIKHIYGVCIARF